VRCVGCCALSPLVFADKQIHSHLDAEKTTALLHNLGKGER
jgi:NADH:ubiquinone oxidoreductase subunit E